MYSSEDGPYKVLLKKGEFTDPARGGRVVPYKIYHPAEAEAGQSPVVLWSHGFGGNRDGAGFISRYLASHGYTLVHMTHDGTDSSLWEGKPGHPWDHLRQARVDRETTLNRFKDVPFVMDQLPGWAAENPEVGRQMDLSRFGMSGHSFGAMTTQVMAGQNFPDEDGKLISMRDPRIVAGILYSPVPIRHLVGETPEPHIYGPIDIPMLYMTGTEDASPLEDFGYKRRLSVYEHAGSPEKYLQVLEGGDHMVYNGTRGKLANNPLREQHENRIKTAALAFWNAKLRDDDEALAYLREMDAAQQDFIGAAE